MSGIEDLYQEVILHHSRSPRNFGRPESFNRQAAGHNPLCGDHVQVFLTLENGRVQDVRFEGQGCAISTASASVMTEAVRGLTQEEAEHLFRRFHALVTGREDPGQGDLGKLAVFSGVSAFPVRVKCASLAWHTLEAALHEDAGTVSTE